MANLGKVIYLSEAQKATLFSNGSITVSGQTINYSDNDLYVTPTGIDTSVSQNSTNLVTSGAVYTSVEGVNSAVTGLSNIAIKDGANTSRKLWITTTEAVPSGAAAGDIVLVKI